MRTLLVGGCSSGVGKTTLVCRILETLRGWGALKLSPVEPHVCTGGPECPECHGMKGDYELFLELDDARGTGTALYRKAGAVRVGWLRSREERLHAAIGLALDRFRDLPGLVVEGNSFARHATPDRIVLVGRLGLLEVKPSARKLVGVADPLVLNRPGDADRDRVLEETKHFLEVHGARRVVDLDAVLCSDPGTVAFLEEIRAWARR